MEPGCKLEGFDRPVQPAAPNRLRCQTVQTVSERYFIVEKQEVVWRKERAGPVSGVKETTM